MIVIRKGKIDVVFCGVFAVGETIDLGDVLHLYLHLLGVGIAAGGKDKERKVGVGLERCSQKSGSLFLAHRLGPRFTGSAVAAHGGVPSEILEIVVEYIPCAHASS